MKKVEDVKIWQVLELVKKRVAKNYVDPCGDSYREHGICSAVDRCHASLTGDFNYNDFDRLGSSCFRDWDGFASTLTTTWPVEGTFYDYDNNNEKWHKRTEYGRRRWELLEHCILWFKERNI